MFEADSPTRLKVERRSSTSSRRLSGSSTGTFGVPPRTPPPFEDIHPITIRPQYLLAPPVLQHDQHTVPRKHVETPRSTKKTRGVERTRTWAEEVARYQRGAYRGCNREDADDPVTTDDSASDCASSGVIDSLLKGQPQPSYLYTPSPTGRKAPPLAPRLGDSEGSDGEVRTCRVLDGPKTGGRTRCTVPGMSALGLQRSHCTSPPSPMSLCSPARKVPSPSVPFRPSTPKPNILSIDEIVRRYSATMASAESDARDKARLEIGLPSPRPETASSTPTTTTSSRRGRLASPTVPSRRSSTPGTRICVVPVRTTSMIHDLDIAQISPRISSESRERRESDVQGMRMGQALLAQLEHATAEPEETSFSSPNGTSSRQSRRATRPPTRVSSRSQLLPPSQDPDWTIAHTMAVYLCSPHLNRFLELPRPFPDRPLRVSLAEVGSPTGRPVVLFLGLGCARYLVALFDDLARAFGIRLICIDRWGLGRTDDVPPDRRGLLAWAQVVEKVLDEIRVNTFQIIAHSAGAPYAAATALGLGERVIGSLHLLAPWSGADADRGYKWLKWIPNGVIKGAVAAEWHWESYRLGKPPPLTYAPLEHTAKGGASSESLDRPTSETEPLPLLSPIRRPSLMRCMSLFATRRESTSDCSMSTPPSRESLNLPRKLGGLRPLAVLRSHSANVIPSRQSLQYERTPCTSTSSEMQSVLRTPLSAGQPDFGLGEGFDTFGTDLGLAIPTLTRSHLDRTKPPTGPALTQALLQASHAECEPGTTADLMSVVLGRDGRPWGFSYSDVQQPCKIWWGSEDDKISEKNMRWMEKSMGAELKVIQGQGHNLMTCAEVMVEVFESLAREAKGLDRAGRSGRASSVLVHE